MLLVWADTKRRNRKFGAEQKFSHNEFLKTITVVPDKCKSIFYVPDYRAAIEHRCVALFYCKSCAAMPATNTSWQVGHARFSC